ncbi:MAG: ribbon-helix-helix protein, CopG family [Chloroflexi bacterium]|nr:ribbon-helix-helix protein, CopG family [Chloroflexota bacterium]
MPRKIIQVPVDDKLLEDLDKMSRKQGKPRAAVIREACARYLEKTEEEELDRQYREGYTKFPEDPAIGEAGLALLAEILPEEEWPDAPR